MAKNEDPVLNKKQKEKLKSEILEEMDSNIKQDLVDEIVNDVRGVFNTSYKKEIKEAIKDELIIEIKDDIRKEEKKLLRKKSFKIFRLNVYIILLIACCLFLLVRLYKTGNLDLTKNKYVEKISSVISKEETTTTKSIIKDLEYYKDNYGYLLDYVKVSNKDLLKGSYDVSDIKLSDKLAIAANALDNDDIDVDGEIKKISDEKLTQSYVKVFGSIDGYDQVKFKTGNDNYAYSESMKSYISIGEDDTKDEYVSNIINAVEEENMLKLTCTVAHVIDDSVYNINSDSYKLAELKDDSVNFEEINNKLSKVTYTFEKVEDGYKLIKIEKIKTS